MYTGFLLSSGPLVGIKKKVVGHALTKLSKSKVGYLTFDRPEKRNSGNLQYDAT